MQTSSIVNEIQLSYKCHAPIHALPQIKGAETAYLLLLDLWDKNRLELVEDCKLLLLNRANHVLGCYHLSSGGTAGTVADPKLIFVAALKSNASGIILAHNHPSGNLQPSSQDRQMTKQLMDAGKLLSIPVLDHLIISNDGYYSFAEGLAFEKVERQNSVSYECQPPF